jgi:four helix bundle protein
MTDRVGDGGFRDLIAWQKAMVLVKSVYELTKRWLPHEQFGLTNQVRRAAVSIPSTIAEGKGRTRGREFSHHLSVAHGSLCELETQLLIAVSLGFVAATESALVLDQAAEVGRLLRGLIKRFS